MTEILLSISVALVVFLILEYNIDGKCGIIPKLFAHTNKKEKVLSKDISNFSLYKSLLKKFYKGTWECLSASDYSTLFVCRELNCYVCITHMLEKNWILSVKITVDKINNKNYNMLEKEDVVLDKNFYQGDKLLHIYQFVKYLMKERHKFLSEDYMKKEVKRAQMKDMLIERLNKDANN